MTGFDAKAAKKEGGKKGVDLSGMCDLGGVQFFNVTIESANGLLEALDVVFEGMNAPVDETAEERRGGADLLGKMLYSAADPGKTLALACHVPQELQERVDMKQWVKEVVEAAGGKEIKRDESAEYIKILLEAQEGEFPLKMRDAAQSAGFGYLKEKGLIPDDDDSDDYIPDPEAAGIEW